MVIGIYFAPGYPGPACTDIDHELPMGEDIF